MPSNVLRLHLKQVFQHIIWISIECDGIESRLPFEIFLLYLGVWRFVEIVAVVWCLASDDNVSVKSFFTETTPSHATSMLNSANFI